jgi:outer membrane protein
MKIITMKQLIPAFLFKKQKVLCVLSCFVIFCIPGFAQQDTQKIDLRTAIDRTLNNNLQIKQAQFQEAITDQNFKQSRLELLPNLNGSGSANRRFGLFFDQTTGRLVNDADGLNGNLSSSVTLFQGGQLRNQILQNKYSLAADKSYVEKIRNDLTLSVVTTYLQILTNRDFVIASEQQVELSKSQLKVAQSNFDVGNNTLADLSQAKSQLANNELSLTNAQNAYEISLLDLKQLMEIDPQTEIEVLTPVVPPLESLKLTYSGSNVYQQALNNNPDIKVAKYNSEVFGAAVKVAKGGLYPSLSFGGGLGTSYSNISSVPFRTQLDENVSKNIGFSLSVPIFNNYRSRTNLTIAKIRYDNALVGEQLAKNTLNKTINQAVLDLRSAEKRYTATQQAFQSSKDAFDVIRKRYEVGLVNAVELNVSQTNFNKSEFDFIQAKYDLIFRSKVIDFYLGNPITLN